MLGNVWEWTHDWKAAYTGNATDPSGPSSPISDDGRVDRGGGWGSDARFLRAALRGAFSPRGKSYGLGFRPARSLFP